MPASSIWPSELERSDQELLTDLWDSQIPWLTSKGSGEQWGVQTVRESRPDGTGKIAQRIKKSQNQGQWGAEWCSAYIAEVKSSGTSKDITGDSLAPRKVPVAGLILDDQAPDYERSALSQQDEVQPFVYVSYIMSNRHPGDLSKGAGAFLISRAKQQVRA